MGLSVTAEFSIFLWCIVCGSIAALIFDLFRVIRRLIYSGCVKTSIEDILYWIIACFLIYYFALLFNGGEIRFYMFAGIITGALLYLTTASPLIVNGFVALIKLICKILSFIFKILYSPVKLILKIIGRPFILIFDLSHNRFLKISERLIINFKNFKNFVTKI